MVDGSSRCSIDIPAWLYGILEEKGSLEGTSVSDLAEALIGRALYSSQPLAQLTSPHRIDAAQSVQASRQGENLVRQDDTVVVAAHPDSFRAMFINGFWDTIQVSQAMQERVTHIAAYRTDMKAITHIAQIERERIEPVVNRPGYVVLHFSEPQPIAPVAFNGGRGKAIQGRQYTNLSRLLMARTLEDLQDYAAWQPTRQEYVRSLITQVIQETPELQFDQPWHDHIRIAFPAWDHSVDPMASTWTATGRSLLFTFDNLEDRLDYNLMLGPGSDRQRERRLRMAEEAPLARIRDVQNPFGKWTVLYEQHILDQGLFDEGSDAQIEDAVRRFWTSFRMHDLPKIDALARSISDSAVDPTLPQ